MDINIKAVLFLSQVTLFIERACHIIVSCHYIDVFVVQGVKLFLWWCECVGRCVWWCMCCDGYVVLCVCVVRYVVRYVVNVCVCWCGVLCGDVYVVISVCGDVYVVISVCVHVSVWCCVVCPG